MVVVGGSRASGRGGFVAGFHDVDIPRIYGICKTDIVTDHDMRPCVGAESDQQVNIYSFIVRCDRR